MKTRPPARRRSPCHADLRWLIEAVADEFDRVISRSKLPVLVSARLGVQGIPTVVLRADGTEISRQVGALPADGIRRWVDGALDELRRA